MKRLLSLLLCLVMVCGLVACGKAPTADTAPDEEIERAINYGIVPEAIQGDYDKEITFSQYTELLTNVITLWDENLLPEWKNITSAAAASDEKMRREDGILEIAYALVMVGHIEPTDFTDGNVEDVQALMENCSPSWQYPLFPTWEDTAFPLFKSSYMWGGIMVCGAHQSLVSGQPIYPFTPDGDKEYLQKPLSRADAIRAALRFGETDPTVFEPNGIYVNVNDVGTYDKTIITDELLAAPTDLPEVTQDKLSNEWKGVGLSNTKDPRESITHYRKFSESDIIFMAENGFNFTRLFFSLSTLRFPDFPEDARQVNENELKELDQLIAWGIEHGVHIQISSSFYLDENGNSKTDGMPSSDKEWALYRDYWKMLTRRYAGISSRYLSFDLCNEVNPEEGTDISFSKAGIEDVVAVLRDTDAERVLLYSFQGNPNMEWVEAMAQLGLAIGCHPYYPQYMTTSDWKYAEQNPYAVPSWPQIYLPRMKMSSGQVPLVLQGAVGGTTVSIHANPDESDGSLVVYADGKEIGSARVVDVQPDNLFSFDIPEGTQVVEVQVTEEGRHYVGIDCILIEGGFGKITIVPHDECDYPDERSPLPIIINEDGTYTNTEDRWIDAQEVYDREIAPMKEIADRNGVGIMINELGIFSVNVYWDIDIVARYHDDVVAMLEEYGLSWCYCELYNHIPKHIVNLHGYPSQWTGATNVQETYGDKTYDICKELLDVFRKYTMQ